MIECSETKLHAIPRKLSQERRARTSGPKVRTGCRTCKIRKVKCDEAKPSCQRCIKFGWRCDGYDMSCLSSTHCGNFRNSASKYLRIKHFQPIFYQPKSTPFNDQQEYRYFRLFSDKTATQLSGCFDSALWGHIILQASHSDPSIRHAVIAIGALHLTLESKSPSNQRSESEDHHKFALQQYSKAILRMRKALLEGSQNLRTTLIASLVIICFESFHGDHNSALAQVRAGLQLVESHFQELTSGSITYFGSRQLMINGVEDELIQAFGRLDIQAMCFIDQRPISIHRELQFYAQPVINAMPTIFDSLKQARVYLEILIQRFMHFKGFLTIKQNQSATFVDSYSEIPIHTSTTIDGLANYCKASLDHRQGVPENAAFAASIYRHRSDLDRWQKSFSPLLALYRLPIYADSLLEATVLRLHCVTLEFAIVSIAHFISLPLHAQIADYSIPATGILNMRKLMPLFKTMLYLARIVIEQQPPSRPLATAQPPSTISSTAISTEIYSPFTLDFHVIVPLYIVGIYCPHSRTRREALRLLLSRPRREGLWDGILAGKMAGFIIEMEEANGLDAGGYVPEQRRMRGAEIGVRYSERSAHLKCFMPLDKASGEGQRLVIKEKFITW